VRHADDHVHLVVTLARQDGAPVRVSNDFYRVGEACRAAERRLSLTRTAPRDRTAPRRPTRAESAKATRRGTGQPARAQLRRVVRTAAAAAGRQDEFLAGLERSGLLVRLRHSDLTPSQVTGYAVALPGDRTKAGRPVWFGGGSLAADLTWPKVSARWSDPTAPHGVTRGERRALWQQASATAAQAAAELRHLTATAPHEAGDVASAAGDVLAVAAHVVEGRRGGALTAAADAFDRAARDLHGRPPTHTPTGAALRHLARALAATGRASRDDVAQAMALVTELVALADAVARLRDVQRRAHQAAAARDAATHLRRVTGPVKPAVHTPLPRTPVPTPAPAKTRTPPTRRKVRS